MDLSMVTEKLRDKTEQLKDENARTSAFQEEEEHDFGARFEDAIQEAMSDLRRFVDSDEFKDVIGFLQTMKEFEEENGKSLVNVHIEEVKAKIEERKKARQKLVDAGAFEKIRYFNEKFVFPLESKLYDLCCLDEIRIFSNGDGCILTHEGFVRPRNSAARGPWTLEEIVREFSQIDDPERHPSKLIPLIEGELKKIAALV